MNPALASRGSSVNGGELRSYGGVLILGERGRERREEEERGASATMTCW